MALTALDSISWALLHPSNWAGEPVSLGQIPADDIVFVAILGFALPAVGPCPSARTFFIYFDNLKKTWHHTFS